MKELVLKRQMPKRDDATTGVMYAGSLVLQTLERPWIPTHPGGKPSESCVPAGKYNFFQHTRPAGDKVLILENPGLAVYRYAADRIREVGRFLILIHSANWVNQVEGCIAPGMGATESDKGPMVTQSRKAMGLLMDWVGGEDGTILIDDYR